MPQVTIRLLEVVCSDTEDVTGADEFYVLGGIYDGANSPAVLTKPININNGQRRPFPDPTTIYDRNISASATIRVALAAYDEDAEKDWAKYGEWITTLSDTLGTAIGAIPTPQTRVAGTIIPIATRAFGKLVALDKDDQLGTLALDLPVATLTTGSTDHSWVIKGRWGGGFLGFSTWEYVVRYRITRTD